MKTFTRILVALLCFAMLLPFASCGENEQQESAGTTAAAAQTEAATTVPEETTDPNSVPDEDLTLTKYNKTVTIFGMEEYSYEYDAAEENGEVINDAVYSRNLKIQENMGITFEYPTVKDNGGKHSNYTDVIASSYQSGDSTSHQLLASLAYYAPAMIVSGYMYNFAAIPNSHMNIEKNYWNTTYIKNSTINGKYYFVVGDMSIRMVQMLEVLFLNDKLSESYLKNEQKSLYDLVYDHEFTFEKFKQLLTYADNGEATGVWGAVLPNNSYAIDGLEAAFGLDLLSVSGDGTVSINTATEHNIAIVEALRELYYNNTAVKADTNNVKAFSGGECVFTVTRLIASTNFQDTGVDYSIYPLPLWNEDQEDYISFVHDSYLLFSIISTVDDETAEMLSAVLEEMNYLSTDTTHVAVYDITFKTRYSDSLKEANMFDFIYERINISTGIIYSYPCGELKNSPRYMVYPTTSTAKYNANTPIASTLTVLAKTQKISMKTFFEAFN